MLSRLEWLALATGWYGSDGLFVVHWRWCRRFGSLRFSFGLPSDNLRFGWFFAGFGLRGDVADLGLG
jgi:hypothetical protein